MHFDFDNKFQDRRLSRKLETSRIDDVIIAAEKYNDNFLITTEILRYKMFQDF